MLQNQKFYEVEMNNTEADVLALDSQRKGNLTWEDTKRKSPITSIVDAANQNNHSIFKCN